MDRSFIKVNQSVVEDLTETHSKEISQEQKQVNPLRRDETPIFVQNNEKEN